VNLDKCLKGSSLAYLEIARMVLVAQAQKRHIELRARHRHFSLQALATTPPESSSECVVTILYTGRADTAVPT